MSGIFVVSYDFSRGGGIGEVSRHIVSALRPSIYGQVSTLSFHGRLKRYLVLCRLFMSLFNKPLLIFTHPFIYEDCRWLLSFFPKTKSIVWVHGIDVWGLFGKMHAPHLHQASLIVAVSSFTKKQVLENFPYAKVIVIPNTYEVYTAYTLPDQHAHGFRILTVSRLAANEQYKGHDLVLKALKVLNDRGFHVCYDVVGAGDDLPRLQAMVDEFALSEQVVFHGFVASEDIYKIYGDSSAFVMPSHVVRSRSKIWGGEGFGLVYLEAGMYGLPVIACNEGGQTDCVVDGYTGFLVSPDAYEVADKIQYLYENPDVAKRMGIAGKKHVQDNFSFETFRDNVLKVIDDVIKDKV